MIVKWIVCQVKAEEREAFSRAQEHWTAVRGAPGFLGQIGGWNSKRPSEACILAFWQDATSYQTFMSDLHDQIFLQSSQMQTYESISVVMFERILDIAGKHSHITDAIGKGNVLFIQTLPEVWNRGTAGREGMLAGIFGRALEKQLNRYLVATIWLDEVLHRQSAGAPFSRLYETSPDRDVKEFECRIIRLEDSWTVL